MKFERGKPDRSLKIGSYSKFKSHLKMEMENILYPLSLSVVSMEEEDSTIDIRSKNLIEKYGGDYMVFIVKRRYHNILNRILHFIGRMTVPRGLRYLQFFSEAVQLLDDGYLKSKLQEIGSMHNINPKHISSNPLFETSGKDSRLTLLIIYYE